MDEEEKQRIILRHAEEIERSVLNSRCESFALARKIILMDYVPDSDIPRQSISIAIKRLRAYFGE